MEQMMAISQLKTTRTLAESAIVPPASLAPVPE